MKTRQIECPEASGLEEICIEIKRFQKNPIFDTCPPSFFEIRWQAGNFSQLLLRKITQTCPPSILK